MAFPARIQINSIPCERKGKIEKNCIMFPEYWSVKSCPIELEILKALPGHLVMH